MSDSVLVDTGSWIALFDPRDEDHGRIGELADVVDLFTLVMPWPVLYETLRTRFVRRPHWVAALERRMKKPGVVFVDDAPYRDDAYALTLASSTLRRRPISMVDMVCRLVIEDPKIRINYLLTTNPGDSHDVCISRGVEML